MLQRRYYYRRYKEIIIGGARAEYADADILPGNIIASRRRDKSGLYASSQQFSVGTRVRRVVRRVELYGRRAPGSVS